jgi:glutathione peroxidase
VDIVGQGNHSDLTVRATHTGLAASATVMIVIAMVRSLLRLSPVLGFGFLLAGCPNSAHNQDPTKPASSSVGPLVAPPLSATSLHDLSAKDIMGVEQKLATYKGKVVLVVNTASQCGYTPQYEGLEKLHEQAKDKGFAVIGFPSNDFGGQEPDNEAKIATFCKTQYGVTFPMFSKVKTKGEGVHPVYQFLAQSGPPGGNFGAPKWNFTKYLVGKDGKVRAVFGSSTTPESAELKTAIDAALRE